MKKSTPSWLITCGCGCALIALVLFGLAASFGVWVKGSTEELEAAVESRRLMEEKFGEPRDFVPWADGAIPAQRMDLFLNVRETTAPVRAELLNTILEIPSSPEESAELDEKPLVEKMTAVFSITKASVGLVRQIGAHFEARNQALLASDMSLGEYTYIYALAYYVWLDHRVDDRGDGIPIPNASAARVHEDLQSMLRNQLESLEDPSSPWGQELAAEIESLSKSDRLPWTEALPPQIAASLEPFRDRLEALYVPEINPIELSRNHQKGAMSFETD